MPGETSPVNRDYNAGMNFHIAARAILLVVLSQVSVAANAQSGQAQHPNIVIMIADNLGFGDVSANNLGTRGNFRTPNIDALAAEGLHLTQFLVEPTCTASRAALMTGRYSIRLGLSWFPAGPENTLQPDEVTLAEMLREVGYHTGYIGKWHLDAETGSQPQNQGFDEWRVGFSGSSDGVLYPAMMAATGAPEEMREYMEYWIVAARGRGESSRVRRYDREYRTQIEADIAASAAAYVGEHAQHEEPFLLVIGWTRPHYPNDVAEDFSGRSGAGKYGDSVVELDFRVGEVLAAIDAAGSEEETLVVFLSDNGPTKTTGGADELFAGSTGPFRGELGDAYEGSIRTMAAIRWPGNIPARRSDEMFAIHDLAPTIAALVGAEVPDDRPIDGVDQSDFVLGRSDRSAREALISFLGDRLVAVRWRQWRIYPVEFLPTQSNPAMGGYTSVISEIGYPQAFNIDADPGEMVNIAPVAGWVETPYFQVIEAYLESLEAHPNPPAHKMTDFREF